MIPTGRVYDFEGNIQRDSFGRIVVDTCSSAADHLRDSVVQPGDDRSRCRNLVEKVFEQHVGKKGRLVISVVFAPEEDGTNTT